LVNLTLGALQSGSSAGGAPDGVVAFVAAPLGMVAARAGNPTAPIRAV